MVWHECSLICSDACGCAAWHVAPTPRTAMPVAMQARSVRRAFKERLTPSLLPPGSPSSARTDDISNKTHRKNRKRNLPLSESDRGRITLSIFLPSGRSSITLGSLIPLPLWLESSWAYDNRIPLRRANSVELLKLEYKWYKGIAFPRHSRGRAKRWRPPRGPPSQRAWPSALPCAWTVPTQSPHGPHTVPTQSPMEIYTVPALS